MTKLTALLSENMSINDDAEGVSFTVTIVLPSVSPEVLSAMMKSVRENEGKITIKFGE